MAFDVSALTTWSQEIADRAAIILKPITGAATMPFLEKYNGITGQNYRLPILETTAPAQAGTACGFTTSGTTTVSQFTLTTVPIKVQEQICLQDLETYFTKSWLPGTSKPDTMDILNTWLERKLGRVSQKIEQTLWQGNTTYTNDTWLKQFNGYIQRTDAAADEVIATGGGAGTALTNSTARGVFEEIIFRKITPAMRVQGDVTCFCGMDSFNVLLEELFIDNLFHVQVTNEMGKMQLTYPGSNVKVVAVPGLNNDNAVDTGALPTAVKNRIICTYKGNLVVGFNAENDLKDFDVWYSKDDQVLKLNMRFHLGVGIKYTDHIVTY